MLSPVFIIFILQVDICEVKFFPEEREFSIFGWPLEGLDKFER
jgi:hypothetical protein